MERERMCEWEKRRAYPPAAGFFGPVFCVTAADSYEVINFSLLTITKQGQNEPRLSFCPAKYQYEM